MEWHPTCWSFSVIVLKVMYQKKMTKFSVIRFSLMLGNFIVLHFYLVLFLWKCEVSIETHNSLVFLMWNSDCYRVAHWNECHLCPKLSLLVKVKECVSVDLFLDFLLGSTEFLHIPFLAPWGLESHKFLASLGPTLSVQCGSSLVFSWVFWILHVSISLEN